MAKAGTRVRIAAGAALVGVGAAIAAIVVQDHSGALPLGLFNERAHVYRWLSNACLAVLVGAATVFALEVVRGRRLALGSLLRRVGVSLLLLEGLVFAVDLYVSRSPHARIGGPYFERANAAGEYVFLRREHAGSAYGFRSATPLPPSPASGTLRLLFLGDSYTEGSGRGFACNYPEVVERALRARTGSAIEVMNAGVGGYGPREEAKLLRLLVGDGYRADAIVLSVFLENDVTDDLPGTDRRVIAGMNERLPHDPFLRAFHPLNARAFRYAVVLWRLGTLSGAERNAAHREDAACLAGDEAFPDPLPKHMRRYVTRREAGSRRVLASPHGMSEFVAAVRDIESEAKALGVPLVVVLFPDRLLADAELRAQFPTEIADSDAPLRVHDAVVTALAGIPIVDTLPLLAALPRAYRKNDTHLSDAGNVAAGEYVAARLAELLPALSAHSDAEKPE
jgi:lysophospholipase L1-like esterase